MKTISKTIGQIVGLAVILVFIVLGVIAVALIFCAPVALIMGYIELAKFFWHLI